MYYKSKLSLTTTFALMPEIVTWQGNTDHFTKSTKLKKISVAPHLNNQLISSSRVSNIPRLPKLKNSGNLSKYETYIETTSAI